MLSQIKKYTDLYNCNGTQFKAAFCYGIKQLSINREFVNSINILPAPNGNTGNNIHKTLLSALQEMEDEHHIGNLAQQCARGALTGASGSSGIILANFLIGFSRAIKDKEIASIADIIIAIREGYLKAKSEGGDIPPGSMLDMGLGISNKLSNIQSTNQTLIDLSTLVQQAALSTMEEIPQKNPSLSKMGINDAGAVGLFYFIDGIYRYAVNSALERSKTEPFSSPLPDEIGVKGVLYSVEFLINNVTLPVEEIKKSLLDVGGSVLFAYENGDMVKVLIRTTDPKRVFDRSARFGKSTKIRVDDLVDEQRYFLSKMQNKDTI